MAEAQKNAARQTGLEAEIRRLERAVATEQQQSSDLRSEARELKFKIEILERSYAKQLADARAQTEAAENDLARQRERNAELDAAREDAIQLLSDAKAEMDRLNAELARLRPTSGHEREIDVDADEGTINTLMNDASWLRRKQPAEEARLKAEAEARAADEAEQGEMIAPELVLAPARRSEER